MHACSAGEDGPHVSSTMAIIGKPSMLQIHPIASSVHRYVSTPLMIICCGIVERASTKVSTCEHWLCHFQTSPTLSPLSFYNLPFVRNILGLHSCEVEGLHRWPLVQDAFHNGRFTTCAANETDDELSIIVVIDRLVGDLCVVLWSGWVECHFPFSLQGVPWFDRLAYSLISVFRNSIRSK